MSFDFKNYELFKSDYFVTNKELELKKKEIAKKLNIELLEPSQDKRIEALFKLLKLFSYKSNIKSYLFQKIIETTESLNSIYLQQIRELDALSLSNFPTLWKERQINHLHYKNIESIDKLEKKILEYKSLLFAYENKYSDSKNLKADDFSKLKVIEDKCFSYWLKSLDINAELRNTIIGYQNRLASFKASHAYINYYLVIEKHVEKMFTNIKKLKKEGIFDYYELLNKYNLPTNKLLNFQLFLQKKIESKLHNAMDLKLPLGNQLDFDYAQIDSNIDLIQKQFSMQQEEIIAIINYYKQLLLQKQIIFTSEAEELINYFKERYIEKINQIFQSTKDFKQIYKNKEKDLLEDEDKKVLIYLAKQELEESLNTIKNKYSKKFVPLLDSFDKILLDIENKYAFDFVELEKHSIELKTLKNLNVQYLIDKFNEEKQKFEEIFNRKDLLINDPTKLTILEVNKIVDKLKDNCEIICSDILSFNQRFWIQINAEFNAEARKYLCKLHYQYAPWNHIWNNGNKPWFHDYLIMNLNQEYLMAIGKSLKDFSPESELFINASSFILQLNEYLREIYKNRDLIEYEHLIKLNTIPKIDTNKLNNICNEKLDDLKETNLLYLKKYNNFYNSLN